MRQDPSDAERRLWNGLRNCQLEGLKFRRQLPIGPFIADFACEGCKLIVEIDGNQHDHQIDYDESRDRHLSNLGWRVMRIYAGDIIKDFDNVISSILGEAKPSP